MCGICGLYSPSDEPQQTLVDGMRARIRHRGPDHGSPHAFGPCVLGHPRLDDGTIAFASESKAFRALPAFRAEPDLPALDAYLALQYVPGTRTGIQGVQRLEPGSLLVVEGESVTAERYWEPATDEQEATDDERLATLA